MSVHNPSSSEHRNEMPLGDSSMGDESAFDITSLNNDGEKRRAIGNVFLQKTCLHPRLTLRNQLLLSFGLVSAVSLGFVVVTAIITALESGDHVRDLSRGNLELWTEEKLATSSRIIAESLTFYVRNLNSLAALMVETTRDRFVGYPDHAGYANDSLVPFHDMASGRNVYPLNASSLIPLEWEFSPMDLSTDNAKQNLQGRIVWYAEEDVTTDTAVLTIQGACDPSETDPTAKRYYPNCTLANNDISKGGITSPTATLELIHRKSSDYATAILKPLFESHPSAKQLGIFFANSGAGAAVSYPGLAAIGTSSYTSVGCDWMRNPNPLDPSRSIGTEEEIARCRPAGTLVTGRNYNVLERNWCRIQALDPSRPHFVGPYKDAHTENLWLLTVGQAVYDRVTNNFIGCTLADLAVSGIGVSLDQLKITNSSHIAITWWNEEGTVIASDELDFSQAENTTSITELGIGVNIKMFSGMKERFLSIYRAGYKKTLYDPIFIEGDKVFAAYPFPVADEYFPGYVPDFLILIVLDGSEVFAAVKSLNDEVDEDIWALIRNILIAGTVGLVSVMFCIYLVSLYLTLPLQWMNHVGDDIVASIGSHVKDIHLEGTSWLRYSPRTEISDLVTEFQSTVHRFSGHGTAKLHRNDGIEVKNPFALEKDFSFLYVEREAESFKYIYREMLPGSETDRSRTNRESRVSFDVEADRVHLGPNIHTSEVETSKGGSMMGVVYHAERKRVVSSRLFWWIVGTITVPLLITMISISVFVSLSISNELPQLISVVKDAFVQFEQGSLLPLAKGRADFASRVTSAPLRDLHLLARVSSWLFSGSLAMADSVTSLMTGAEQCKDSPFHSCPYVQNRTNTPCDCKWMSDTRPAVSTVSCIEYNVDSRYLQQVFWTGSRLDISTRGEIETSSYPEVAFSPQTTSWWDDWQELPGYADGFNASSFDSTYELVHAISVLSMVHLPLFNYQLKVDTVGSVGSYLAFEETGIFSGYNGCDYSHVFAAFFSINGSGGFNPQLCPEGKFGYDPRCREWYHGAELTYLDGGAPLYITPSYQATSGVMAESAVLPVEDSRTLEYIGQALVDVDVGPILDALTQKETPLRGGFHVLISATPHNFGTETVLGPGFSFEDLRQGESFPVENSVLPFDVCKNGSGAGCMNIERFREIVSDMRAGKSGSTTFTRTTVEGGSEVVYWAYAPVTAMNYNPTNSSTISGGVESFETIIFSLALAETEPGLNESFESVQEELDRIVGISSVVLAVLMLLASLAVMFISSRVTVSIIDPVSRLLSLVLSIRHQDILEDIPEIQGGSVEFTKVRDTFERLYMVVRFANTAFFSGHLEKAYETLLDALALFTKLRNEKAIGVANNNLGNMMLTAYRTMKSTKAQAICGLSKDEIIQKGVDYFKQAIDHGETALALINQNEGWSNNYLVFMQQLSNRYFNRAMFLLTTKGDHAVPESAEAQGLTDLATAKDMDREVVDNGDHHGFKGDSDVYFDLLIGRIKGILLLLEMGYEDEWGIMELFDDALVHLNSSLSQPADKLFKNLEPAGQFQRVDAVLIEYYRMKGDYEDAAKIAIRMMVEDEYILNEAAASAIKALIDYLPQTSSENLGGKDPSDMRSELFQYRQKISEATQMMTQDNTPPVSGRQKYMMRETFRQSSCGDVSMELF